MRLTKLIQSILIVLLLSSCYHNRKLVYLQNENFSEKNVTQIDHERIDYQLQTNDVITVKVKSSMESETSISKAFNITSYEGTMFFTNPGTLYLEGYSIDDQGKITLPVIGSLTVKGLTLNQAQEQIQTQVTKYLNNATVLVKLVSFKITVLGEVRTPGYYYVYNNQCTVLEALGLAGDLNQGGNRNNIKLMRQTATGTEVALLDLTDPGLLKSKYYYVMPNDVLYVEPMKTRTKRANLEVWSLAFSAITTAILVLSYIDSN